MQQSIRYAGAYYSPNGLSGMVPTQVRTNATVDPRRNAATPLGYPLLIGLPLIPLVSPALNVPLPRRMYRSTIFINVQ